MTFAIPCGRAEIVRPTGALIGERTEQHVHSRKHTMEKIEEEGRRKSVEKLNGDGWKEGGKEKERYEERKRKLGLAVYANKGANKLTC